MEYADYMRFFFALMFVVGLIGGTAVLARRFGLAPGTATGGRASHKRLEIVDSLSLDPKRRVVIIRRDDQEHLLLLGAENETILEQSFMRPAAIPATAQPLANSEPVETAAPSSAPSEDDDVFARLRKVAELMNEKRAIALRGGSKPQRRDASGSTALIRKTAGDRA